MLHKLTCGLLIALVACTDGSEDTKQDDTGPQDDTGLNVEDTQAEEAFVPNEGLWSGTYAINKNECEAETSSGDASFTITNVADQSYTLTVNGIDLSCALDDRLLVCEPEVIDKSSDWNVSILTSVSSELTFETESIVSGLSSIEYSCVGDDCDDILDQVGIDLPCVYTMSLDATFQK